MKTKYTSISIIVLIAISFLSFLPSSAQAEEKELISVISSEKIDFLIVEKASLIWRGKSSPLIAVAVEYYILNKTNTYLNIPLIIAEIETPDISLSIGSIVTSAKDRLRNHYDLFNGGVLVPGEIRQFRSVLINIDGEKIFLDKNKNPKPISLELIAHGRKEILGSLKIIIPAERVQKEIIPYIVP